MLKKCLFLMVVMALSLGSQVQAVTIVWVSEWMSPGGGIPYDQGWIDLLREQGYTVDADTTSNFMVLDAAHLATLEAADLIVVSRTSNSGNYTTDATETTQWNSVRTPLILLSGYLTRSSRWQWLNTTSVTEFAAETMLQAVKTDHPVFAGISLDNGQVDVIDAAVNSGQATFNTGFQDVGNGTLIASRADDSSVWIAEWAAGVPFYSGTTETPGGKRMLIEGAGGGGGQAAGSMNFTPTGQKMFLNAVAYMLGIVSTPGLSSGPQPTEGQTDVPRDVVLAWKPGEYAKTHDVYLGTVLEDVNTASKTDPKGVLVSPGQTLTTYSPSSPLAFGQAYYWRVDEVNAPDKPGLYKGGVWSFTSETYGYPITTPIQATASSFSNALTGPEKTIDGSGIDALDQHSISSSDMWLSKSKQTPVWIQYEFDTEYNLYQMWVWNSNQLLELDYGYGAKDVTIEVSTDGTTWTTLAGVPEFAQATAEESYVHNTTVDFGGVLARYVRLNINSNWGDARSSGLSEVRFFYVPVNAFGPAPATGASEVAVDDVLNWRPGRKAASHEVYLGTDPNALSKVGTVTGHNYSLVSAGAEYDRTYYWKVNEVNNAEVWGGEVWSFSTVGHVIVDDFETYNDNCSRIFYSWADGYGATLSECGGAPVAGNGSGSTVGNASAPYAERTVVHGGRQSMPMAFDNPGASSYSEATRTFEMPQDWTKGGIKTLVLYFQGASDNAAGQMYVKINNSKVLYNGKSDVLTIPLWRQWNIDLASVGGALRSVTSLTIGVSGSGRGIVYVDDIQLYRSAPAVVQPVDPGTAGLSAYYAMDGDLKDSSGKGNNGTAVGDPIFVDAPAGFGKALQFDGTNDYVDLPIGTLVSTLSSVTIATRASFDTGSTGSFQRIFDFGTGTTAYLFLTPRVSTNGVIRAAIRNTNSTAESQANSPLAMPAGWHHVAVSIDGADRTIQLYVDGERVASGPTTVLLSDLGPTTQNWLGRSQWTADAYLSGALDEFRIYNRVLSAGEVRYLAGDR